MIEPPSDPLIEPLPWQHSQWSQLQQAVDKGQLPHAILLAGIQGMGKHDFAKRLACALLCEQPGPFDDACGQCRTCHWLKAESHPDLFFITPQADSQSIKIAQIRELQQVIHQTSHCGGYRIIIIEPAEAMNNAAANALLKVLEEPGDKTLFLLVSHQAHTLLATLRSRCQKLSFPPLEDAELMDYFGQTENIQAYLPLLFGAPLKMQALIDKDRSRQHAKLLDELFQCLEGDLEVCQLAKQWQAIELSDLLESLHVWIMLAVKLHLSESVDIEAAHLAQLHRLNQHTSLAQLYCLLDRIAEMKRHLLAAVAINPVLWCEGLIVQFLDARY